MSQLILMMHVFFGVLGTLLAVALLVDIMHLSAENRNRIYLMSLVITAFILLSYLVGGYWYVTEYAADKAIIKAGAWPWAHGFAMEVKEHIFFILLLLSLYLPFVASRIRADGGERLKKLALTITGLIIALGLTMDGMGAIIAMGVRMGMKGGV